MSTATAPGAPASRPINYVLTAVGGVLMGLANVIPGVSGGTIILAIGLYEEFIDAVSQLTRLKFRLRPIIFLVVLGAFNLLAILLLSNVIKYFLTHHHMVTFAVFIGLALGGVPILWRMMRPIRPSGWAWAVVGFATMVVVSFLLGRTDFAPTWPMLIVAGMIAAGAMVLPGISGSHMLLVMGLYTPIIAAISNVTGALRKFDWAAMWGPIWDVIVPAGLGIFLGIVILSNLLELLFKRFHHATMGYLMGLLVGSVLPLNPFRAPSGHKDLFEAAAPMTPLNVALVAVGVAAGFTVTMLIGRLGRRGETASPPA